MDTLRVACIVFPDAGTILVPLPKGVEGYSVLSRHIKAWREDVGAERVAAYAAAGCGGVAITEARVSADDYNSLQANNSFPWHLVEEAKG